jgi:hypothetical protein
MLSLTRFGELGIGSTASRGVCSSVGDFLCFTSGGASLSCARVRENKRFCLCDPSVFIFVTTLLAGLL